MLDIIYTLIMYVRKGLVYCHELSRLRGIQCYLGPTISLTEWFMYLPAESVALLRLELFFLVI
jgi:hypothetical protein